MMERHFLRVEINANRMQQYSLFEHQNHMLETIDKILITILSCRYIELYSYELGNGTCANNEDKDQQPQNAQDLQCLFTECSIRI